MKKFDDITLIFFILSIGFLLSIAELIGFEIPLIKAVVYFFIVTFIPGLLILRILNVNTHDLIKTILFSVGLSISFITFIVILINFLLPIVGIGSPLEKNIIILSILLSIIILGLISYFLNKNNFFDLKIKFQPYLSNSSLFLLIIPFFSIIGTYYMNYYNSNLFLLILLILIATVPILIVFDKIPKELYPLSIFVSSISLLFYTCLTSPYIWGWDINTEYYFAKLAIENGFWNYALPYEYNSIPMLTMLTSVYSAFLNIDIVWIYKIIFPMLFSIVPLGIYSFFKDQFKEKISILAPFIFMFYYGFFKTMPGKQMIAEIFLVLLIMLIIDKRLPNLSKKILAIIFSFSLVISHYGISYLFLLMITLVLVFSYLFKNKKNEISLIKTGFLVLFCVMVFSWFIYISGGISFNTIIGIFNNVVNNLSDILLTQSSRTGASYSLLEMPTYVWSIYQSLNYLLQIFIFMGILSLLYHLILQKKKLFCTLEYSAISIAAYIFLIISIFLTFGLGMDRAIQINLIILAPFAIIGYKFILDFFYRLIKVIKINFNCKENLKLFAIFLSLYLFFSSGLIFEITNDPYPSLFTLRKNIEFPVFNNEEISGAIWLKKYTNGSQIYTEGKGSRLPQHRTTLLLSSYFIYDNLTKFYFYENTTKINQGSYIYLGSFAEKGFLLGSKTFAWSREHIILNKTSFYKEIITKSNKIYSNGGSSNYYMS